MGKWGRFRSGIFVVASGGLMRLQPVLSLSAVGDQRDTKRHDLLHLFEDDLLHTLSLIPIDVEVQLVVHLQDHLAAQAFGFESLEDTYHC